MNRGPDIPLQNEDNVHPPPLLEFKGPLPPPSYVVSTDLAGGPFSFRCSTFTQRRSLTPISYTETKTGPTLYMRTTAGFTRLRRATTVLHDKVGLFQHRTRSTSVLKPG